MMARALCLLHHRQKPWMQKWRQRGKSKATHLHIHAARALLNHHARHHGGLDGDLCQGTCNGQWQAGSVSGEIITSQSALKQWLLVQ
jgi:hypothetical protein